MREDEEGFLYPQTDTSKCIGCGLCEKVCPVLNQGEKRKPLHVYAAKNTKTRIRLQSSSGGIFTHIAEQIIQKNGVVFGARFDENWAVEHACTETLEGLAAMRGQQVCAKPYRPHLPAGKRISGIRPSGALFGHSLSNKRFKAFFGKRI